ncbi:MAG: tetratricopeptide repeat protein, partial [Rhodospirillales bacterium]|nr:tetratricopeptide repeat protein [Rhodospirillales bacterium]
MDKENARKTFHAAIERQRLGDLDAAERLFAEVLRTVPGHPSSLHNLGLIYQHGGRHVEAVAAFQHLVDDAPDDMAARFALASALQAAGRLGDSEGVLRDVVGREPGMVDALVNLGLVLGERGNTEESEEISLRAVNLAPERPDAHYAHAMAHRISAAEPEIETMRRLVASDVVSEEHRILLEFALGKAHDDLGDYDAAFSWYRRANLHKARETRFDAAHHRGEMAAIKAAFRGAQPAPANPAHGPVSLFVVGLSRSGKSLIESVLARHQGVLGLEERFGWHQTMRSICDKHGVDAPFPDCAANLPEAKAAEMGAVFHNAVAEAAPNSRLAIHTRPD